MKTTLLKLLIAIIATALLPNLIYAQWTAVINQSPNRFLRTATNNQGAGVGFFTSTNRPLSAFHINTNITNPSPDFTPGEVFRTDAPSGQTTFWRMFRGGTERARIYNPTTGSGSDLHIETPQVFGSIQLRTSQLFVGPVTRMVITDGTTGNVGIGNNFLGPLHLLDVRNGDINTGNGTPASPQGYMIGDEYVLRHKGEIKNIYVSVEAAVNDITFFGANRAVA